jgi:hypothetical protein
VNSLLEWTGRSKLGIVTLNDLGGTRKIGGSTCDEASSGQLVNAAYWTNTKFEHNTLSQS